MSDVPISIAPVVLIIFNRPELASRIFQRVRAARPPKLFVIADGPRAGKPDEPARCAAARAVTEQVDWPCEVHRDYADVNLGSGRRVASGLDRVFQQVESAIILEDDCLPDPTFFLFCSELLVRYRDEARVGTISGSHHQREVSYGDSSYYFCRYGNTWGWATWRRAWSKFDYTLSKWPHWRDSGDFERFFPDPDVRRFWQKVWNDAPSRDDVWDYQWTFCYLSEGMLGILPRTAMIRNIGFGADATHTAGMEDVFAEVQPMVFPLHHPTELKPDLEAERKASRRFFAHRPFWQRVAGRLRRYVAHLTGGGQ